VWRASDKQRSESQGGAKRNGGRTILRSGRIETLVACLPGRDGNSEAAKVVQGSGGGEKGLPSGAEKEIRKIKARKKDSQQRGEKFVVPGGGI